MKDALLRRARAHDAAGVANLLQELGYAAEASSVAVQLTNGASLVWIAERDEGVIGVPFVSTSRRYWRDVAG